MAGGIWCNVDIKFLTIFYGRHGPQNDTLRDCGAKDVLPMSRMARTERDDPEIMVVPSVLAVGTHSRYWSPNPLNWRLSHWILLGKVAPLDASPKKPEEEEFFVPRRGTYLPWSDGPQNCLGKKFAPVEFVAVLAQLLQMHRVRLNIRFYRQRLREGPSKDSRCLRG